MRRFFAWDESLVEKDGIIIEEFPDEMTARAFADAMGWSYYEHKDNTYNAMQEKEDAIRKAVNRYLVGKSRHIEISCGVSEPIGETNRI